MKIENIPEGTIINIKLNGQYYLKIHDLGEDADTKNFCELDLKEINSNDNLIIPYITKLVGAYFGKPIHPNSNMFSGGLENVFQISPFMNSRIVVRVMPNQIKSYERVGSLKELEFAFKQPKE